MGNRPARIMIVLAASGVSGLLSLLESVTTGRHHTPDLRTVSWEELAKRPNVLVTCNVVGE